MNQGFVALVLAAGQGTRMKSDLPKVLFEVAGRPMVAWSVEVALEAGAERAVVVVGHGREKVTPMLEARYGERVISAIQAEQRGTADAVRCALEAIPDYDGLVVVSYGDCPLLPASLVRALVETGRTQSKPVSLLTATVDDPTGYGRILRDGGEVRAIREQKDCSPEERAIREVNPGVYAFEAPFLRRALTELTTDNAQGELYLTDVVAIAARTTGVASIEAEIDDVRGVNDRYELALADARMRRRIVRELARSGVTVRDPETTYVDADAIVEPGAVLAPNVHLRGRCRVAAGAHVDVGCVLERVEVGPGVRLKPYTVAEDSRIGEKAHVGPFAHLRPESDLGPESRIGNFVETKKTRLGRGSKANHLAYIGDGEIGEDVNIGAGTIFCNYDGVQKNTTVLEDGVFIGSDSQLVAPVRVGRGAYVASGTTVVRDVPADALAVSRAKQENKEGYASRLRRRSEAAKKRRQNP